jgi:hypothetical protein
MQAKTIRHELSPGNKAPLALRARIRVARQIRG